MYLSAGRIDALLIFEGSVLRTAQPARTRFGIAQLRRELGAGPLRVLHLVFAPETSRPVLLGIVRLRNAGTAPAGIDYTEIWEVGGSDFRSAPGACEVRTAEGLRALAEASLAVRARAPDPPLRSGLALSLRLLLPPQSVRELHFAYAAPGPDESAAVLVRAWRGAVPAALAESVRAWQLRLGGSGAGVAEYRAQADAIA